MQNSAKFYRNLLQQSSAKVYWKLLQRKKKYVSLGSIETTIKQNGYRMTPNSGFF